MLAAKKAVINLVSVAILTLGFAQFAVAGVVSSSEFINAELLELVNGIENQVAGSDGVAIVGAVFIVLIVLELVGVTDIFKSF